jgi:DNA-binding MarR family transcriptional regulator
MARDLIGELGYLALGSRFRRLGERLQVGAAAIARKQGIELSLAHLPILMALAERPLSVSGIVGRLDIAQPAVTRSVAKLLEDGLIELATGNKEDDRRQRKFRLSRKGKALLDRAQGELFPAVERAVAAICAEPGADLLAYLDRLDDALREAPLGQQAPAGGEVGASKVGA